VIFFFDKNQVFKPITLIARILYYKYYKNNYKLYGLRVGILIKLWEIYVIKFKNGKLQSRTEVDTEYNTIFFEVFN